MRILGIIPARGGSKGVPEKNIKLLGNKPLIAYTINAAKSAKLLTEVIVSSDDSEIIDTTRKYGAKAPFTRPKEIATDKSPSILTVIHALQFFKEKGIAFDAVCLLQPTNPFRTGIFIDDAIKKFIQTKVDSLISVLPVPHKYNPHWVFEPDKNDLLHISTGEDAIISRRQELPKAYYRDGSVYLTKANIVLEKQSLYGNTIGYIEATKDTHVNIDTLEDWEKAEKLLVKLGL